MNYKRHRKELLRDKAVRTEHERLRPEYELARSILDLSGLRRYAVGRGDSDQRRQE